MVFHRRLSFHSHEHALYVRRVIINLWSIFFLLDGIYIRTQIYIYLTPPRWRRSSVYLASMDGLPIDDTTLPHEHIVAIYIDFAVGYTSFDDTCVTNRAKRCIASAREPVRCFEREKKLKCTLWDRYSTVNTLILRLTLSLADVSCAATRIQYLYLVH